MNSNYYFIYFQFDPAVQKFMSMKVSQFEYFQPNMRTSLIGICAIVLPMIGYGYLVRNERAQREEKIRNGELRYRDRIFKLA